MVINTNSSYIKKDSTPIDMKLDIRMLTNLCRYILQHNSLVRMEHLVNLRRMISYLNPNTYENDHEKVKRINFILKGLEARLDNNLNDIDIILTYINGGLTYQVDFLDYNNLVLSRDEVIFLHKLISETIQYRFIYPRANQFNDILTRYMSSGYENRGNIVSEFKEVLASTLNDFRRAEVNNNSVDMHFSLREGTFENCVTDTYNLITNPSRRLITGMQGLNEMTGGGFESGRVYMLLGTSGVGKSITLLNLIYQIKRANIFYKSKDPSKTPCIVLLTMENTVVETITRLFDLVIEHSHGMANYSCNDVINMLREQGELRVNDSSPIDIVIRYKANKSVDTSYLYTLCDDLEDEGYEVICLVQDHVKRIRSIYNNTDIRLELGDVVNELKTFAAEKDIPVITNSHLNRDASRIIEDHSRKSTQDAGKLLGKSNIGESMLVIDNLDCAIIITLDFDKDENRYMTFNLVKMRDKNNGRSYIAQPFVPGSTIRLMEDLGGIPQFKETIHAVPELKNNTCIKMSGASTMVSDINAVIDVNEEDIKNNAFVKQSYNLNPEIKPAVIKPITFVSDQSSNFAKSISSFKKPDLPKVYTNDNKESERKAVCPITFDYDPLKDKYVV